MAIGLAWNNDMKARWSAIRDSAHEKLFPLLQDAVPEVRAATAFALGTFIRSGGKAERSEHANSIDHSVALKLVNAVQSEASPLVRKEVVGFSFSFVKVAQSKTRPPADCGGSAMDRPHLRIHFRPSNAAPVGGRRAIPGTVTDPQQQFDVACRPVVAERDGRRRIIWSFRTNSVKNSTPVVEQSVAGIQPRIARQRFYVVRIVSVGLRWQLGSNPPSGFQFISQ